MINDMCTIQGDYAVFPETKSRSKQLFFKWFKPTNGLQFVVLKDAFYDSELCYTHLIARYTTFNKALVWHNVFCSRKKILQGFHTKREESIGLGFGFDLCSVTSSRFDSSTLYDGGQGANYGYQEG